jgi:hypothetical protein
MASKFNIFNKGDIVVVSYAERQPHLFRYVKGFVADDGEILHRVDSIETDFGAHQAIVPDEHIELAGELRFFAVDHWVYELENDTIRQAANFDTSEAAGRCAQLMQAGLDAAQSELRPSAGKLFLALEHGNAEHRAWLRTAINAIFAGEPVPLPA